MNSVETPEQTLGTPGHHFQGKVLEPSLAALPGMPLNLPINVVDELLQDVTDKSTFFARISEPNSSIFLLSPYTLNRSVILYGAPDASAKLVVSTQHIYSSVHHTINVILKPCPPGYYHENSTCYCSSSTENKLKAYEGILRCNRNFTAVLKRGYWTGYHGDELYTAPCPFHFCVPNTLVSSEQSLPDSRDSLESFMCGDTRQGVLCGKCKDGYSVYYHSRQFTCGKNDKCQFGIFLFRTSACVYSFYFNSGF